MKKRGLDGESTWRYFCGVVWNEIKERQRIAAKYMVEDDPAPTKAPDDVEFPADSVACGILAEIMRAVGASTDVADLADSAMAYGLAHARSAWNGQEKAYRSEDWFPDPGYPLESAVNYATAVVASDLHGIGKLRRSEVDT